MGRIGKILYWYVLCFCKRKLGDFYKQAGLFGSSFWLLEVQSSMASWLFHSMTEMQRGKWSNAEASMWVLLLCSNLPSGELTKLPEPGSLDCTFDWMKKCPGG